MVNIQFYKGIMTCRETQAFILWVWEQKELFTVASCVTWVSLASCLFCADEGECLGLTSNLYKYILKRYPYIFSYIFLNDRSKPQVLKEVKWYLIHLIGIGVNRSDGKLARDKLISSKSFFLFQCTVPFKIFTNQAHTLFQQNYYGHMMWAFYYLMFHRNRAVVLCLHINSAILGGCSYESQRKPQNANEDKSKTIICSEIEFQCVSSKHSGCKT